MTDDERIGREAMVKILESGESLAFCLGYMIRLVQLCGNDDERRMARAADGAAINAVRPN